MEMQLVGEIWIYAEELNNFFTLQPHFPVFDLRTESNNGYLVTLVELDREEMASYVVEVLVEDGGQPRLNDTATVSLTITDINDNPPVWVSGNGTSFSILEVAMHIHAFTYTQDYYQCFFFIIS